MKRPLMSFVFVIGLLLTRHCAAHGFGGAGWIHPLTGPDHMLAMIAVGAWSAQMGGRAIYVVPAAFVTAMAVGGALGCERIELWGTDWGVALSVMLLGFAIASQRKLGMAFAVAAVALFGVCHGWAHGYEMPMQSSKAGYIFGFLLTTAGLHGAGVVGGMLIIEGKSGHKRLRLCGALCAAAGVIFVAKDVIRL